MGERLSGAALSAQMAEIKDRVRLSDVIGRTVKLHRAGREFIGLSPFTHEKTPSFTINDDKRFYHCFSSGKNGDLFDWLREGLGLGFGDALDEGRKLAGLSDGPLRPAEVAAQKQRRAEREKEQAADAARRQLRAGDIWRAATPGAGHPLIEGYLRHIRAIDLSVIGGVPAAIRFHGRLRNRSGHYFPAMVTRVADAAGAGRAVHITFLKPDGTGKIDPDQGPGKQILGSYFGLGVRLFDSGGAGPIFVGEGIESVLSAAVIYTKAGRAGAFDAALSLGNLTGAQARDRRGVRWQWGRNSGAHNSRRAKPDPARPAYVPADIAGRAVTILAEDDLKPMDGPDGRTLSGTARARMMFGLAAAKFERAGAGPVTIAWPPSGCDFNDILLRRRAAETFQEDLRYA